MAASVLGAVALIAGGVASGIPHASISERSLADTLRAVDLRCDSLVEPIGLGEPNPGLSWRVESDRRGAVQRGYRILVASTTERLAANQADLWDSGRVEGPDTTHVRYAGKALRSGEIAHWKVMSWVQYGQEKEGVPGPWSAPARWEMGILEARDGAPTDDAARTAEQPGDEPIAGSTAQPVKWTAEWLDASPIPPTRTGERADAARAPVTILRAIYLPAQRPVSPLSPGADAAPIDWSEARAADVTTLVADAVARGDSIAVTNDALGGDPAFGVPKRLVVDYAVDSARLRRECPEQGQLAFDDRRLPLLRGDFVVDRPVQSARLHATALGVYDVHLNGERVGDLALAPGWTDYRRRVHRQTHDVTAQIRQGRNALGAAVAPGWYAGRAGLFHARAFYGSTPAFACQLEIVYQDGTTQRFATDGSWRRCAGPTLSADLMDGETFDARAAIDGWCDPEVPLAADLWRPVALRDPSTSDATPVIESSMSHTVKALMELPAQRVSEPAPGRWTFDLGQNMVGVVRLALTQPAGTVVTIRHAEILAPDRTIDATNLRGAPSVDTYICRGSDGEPELWEPRFTFHGFRYVELSGLVVPDGAWPPLDAVTGVVLGSDLPGAGSFRCSDDDVNQLHSNIVWGLRGNALSIPTDCPQRDERMGWSGDVQAFVPTGTYIADLGPFFGKWLVDLHDAQRDDGAHSDVAPVMRGLSYGSHGWADAGTIVPWVLYRRSGDRRILERHIDGMMRHVDWCERHSEGLLRTKGLGNRGRGNDYGDWLAVDAPTSKELIGTAYFAHSAELVAKSLRALDRTEDAARYQSLFERIGAAFAKAFLDDDGHIAGGTQTAYVLALRFGLVPEALRDRAVAHLVEAIEARNGHLSTGFLGSGHLLPVLDAAGRDDLAYELLVQREYPSWLFPVRHGATTIWERWDGWTPQRGAHPDISMNSFNHFAFGSCGEWLYEGVAGIAQAEDDAGFERIVIRPRVDGPITWVEAEHRSIRGPIGSSWRRVGDGGSELALAVRIPANATATVVLPARPESEPLESGVPLADAEGVTVVKRTEEAVILEVGSGEYAFTSELARRTSGNPVLRGRYADPEAVVFDGRFWIYPTTSAPYDEQLHLDAFSSEDLVHWTKHPRVLDAAAVSWVRRALWAPAAVEKDGRYYLFFAANDIQRDGPASDQLGGIGVAVSDSPAGPFRDHIGSPLVSTFHHGAQPIDPFVFRDDDGTHYLLYGGWGHCAIARLRNDFTGLVPFEDGTLVREITPEGYVEGPCMFRRDGLCYFMWSEGGWTGPDYAVAYGTAPTPLGPFVRAGRVLQHDPSIATGAGHHSVIAVPGRADRFIVYHRRPLGKTDRNDRVVCIDRLRFDDEGRILPVQMTHEGIEAIGTGSITPTRRAAPRGPRRRRRRRR